MLKIFKSATDKVMHKTKHIVKNLRKKEDENQADVSESKVAPETERMLSVYDSSIADLRKKQKVRDIQKSTVEDDSEYITEYSPHCFVGDSHENDEGETEYEVHQEITDNDIKPEQVEVELVNKTEEIKRIPITRKVADTLINATMKIKDTTTVAVEESGKAFRGFTRFFDAHLKIILFASTLGLISIGTVMIFSASSKVAMQSENIGDAAFFVKKHLFFVGLSFIGLYITYRLKLSFFQKHWKKIAGLAFLLLVLVLIPGIGTNYNGARRWIRFGPIGFQPSDFAKLAVVIALSVLLVKRQHIIHRFRDGFIPLLGLLGIFCAVLVVEPDFGTTLFLGATGIILMLVGGVRFRHLVPIVLVLLPVMSLFVIMKFDHIKPRIETFLNPEADPMGKGYQVHQAKIAQGKGGLTGVGLGKSHQSLYYLPEESTDFIFAIVGEELGFMGTSTILMLFLLMMLAGLRLAYISDDMFLKLMATGLTTLIIFQALINMMVVTATVPNKGIALPFISFGGSLTFFYSLGIGIILRIADEAAIAKKAKAKSEADSELRRVEDAQMQDFWAA